VTPLQLAAIHTLFEWLALLVGARLYLRSAGPALSQLRDNRKFGVLFGCVAGAAIGNKAVHWLQRADQWPLLQAEPWAVLQGQSIVGGLLGGLIGVEIGKRLVGVHESTGDRFVLPVLVGLAIGRVGCYFAGLADDTYGNPTALPWGVDFGDGVARHPTQLYDIAFAGAALLWLQARRDVLARVPGLSFKLMLAGYLAWRLAIDALKPVPFDWAAGLSGIQWICIIALLAYLPLVAREARRLHA
jgi:phosphatidylglycerol---prolipoprotein diacylglyceryl transferase